MDRAAKIRTVYIGGDMNALIWITKNSIGY